MASMGRHGLLMGTPAGAQLADMETRIWQVTAGRLSSISSSAAAGMTQLGVSKHDSRQAEAHIGGSKAGRVRILRPPDCQSAPWQLLSRCCAHIACCTIHSMCARLLATWVD